MNTPTLPDDLRAIASDLHLQYAASEWTDAGTILIHLVAPESLTGGGPRASLLDYEPGQMLCRDYLERDKAAEYGRRTIRFVIYQTLDQIPDLGKDLRFCPKCLKDLRALKKLADDDADTAKLRLPASEFRIPAPRVSYRF